MAVEKKETIVNGDLLDEGLLNMPGLRVNGDIRYERTPNGKVVPVVRDEPDHRTNQRTVTTGHEIDRVGNRVKHHDDCQEECDDEYDQMSFDGSGWTDNVKTNSTIEKLRRCAKSTTIFGGMSMLFFYWQQTGQMLQSAAYPAIVVCALLVGWGIGKNIK